MVSNRDTRDNSWPYGQCRRCCDELGYDAACDVREAISTVVYPQQPCKQAKSARPGVWGEAPRFFFFFLFFIIFLKK